MAAISLWKLDEHLSTTQLAFDALKNLIHHSRASLVSERRKAEKIALKNARSLRWRGAEKMTPQDETLRSVMACFGPVMTKYGGDLPRLLNYSCLIQLYALFEDRGAALCDELQKRNKKIPLRLHELGQTNLQTIRAYLSKLCKIDFGHWHEIELLSQLRHRIVHHNGHTSDAKLIMRIKATKGLYISEPYAPAESRYDEYDVDLMPDPGFIPKEGEKARPFIIVRNSYVDSIVATVSGLFEQVFKEKRFGDPSPFVRRPWETPFMIKGIGKNMRVKVTYQD